MSNSKNPHIIILGVIFTIAAIIAINFFITNESNLLSQKFTEENNIINTNNENTIKKEGYISDINKPFDPGNYDYDERTLDFRLVCSSPCPVSKAVLDQEFAAISYALATIRGLTQSDIKQDYLPFEVHASEDMNCPYNTNAAAYMTTLDNRGLLCFFYDKISYDRSKFPYSTSVHEVTHLFEYGKIEHDSVIWEGLSEMLDSFFLKGNDKNSFCWQGNAWFKELAKNNDDPHWAGGNLFFELCNTYGFDYDDLPSLFNEIDRKGYVSIQEFVSIINKIVGYDTTELFRTNGVNI